MRRAEQRDRGRWHDLALNGKRPYEAAAGNVGAWRFGKERVNAGLCVAEERIRGEIPVDAFLPRDAADPVAAGVAEDVGAGNLDCRRRVTPDSLTECASGHDGPVNHDRCTVLGVNACPPPGRLCPVACDGAP
jgi:hypothetical protein